MSDVSEETNSQLKGILLLLMISVKKKKKQNFCFETI